MEDKIKHLEFIQSNIARMNQCSFQMKGWTITIVSALLAIYASTIDESGKGNVMFIFIGIFPTVLFWLLDGYYLQQERKFRGVYNDVVSEIQGSEEKVKSFEMPLNKYKRGKYCFLSGLSSRTEWPLYLSIIVLLAIAGNQLK